MKKHLCALLDEESNDFLQLIFLENQKLVCKKTHVKIASVINKRLGASPHCDHVWKRKKKIQITTAWIFVPSVRKFCNRANFSAGRVPLLRRNRNHK